MAHRSQTLGIALIAVLLALMSCARRPKSCEVCQRAECTGLAFRMELTTGKTVETCCPRCGLRYLRDNHREARTMEATDYTTGKWIDATKAVYVSGSDVMHCAAEATRRDAQGCCFFKAYDRCLPSLIAFQNEREAVAFQQQHGGQLVHLQEIAAQSK
jgi:hypothetical protein